MERKGKEGRNKRREELIRENNDRAFTMKRSELTNQSFTILRYDVNKAE
jgi:hypothetical protein